MERFDVGANYCFKNAEELFESSVSLFNNGKNGVACSLMVLCAEESFKSILLLSKHFDFPVTDDELEKAFTDHKYKLRTIKSMLVGLRLINKLPELLISELACYPDEMSLENIVDARKKSVMVYAEWLRSLVSSKKNELNKLMKWWEQAKALKENGFYVSSKEDSWKIPQNVNKKRFLIAKGYVEELLENNRSLLDSTREGNSFLLNEEMKALINEMSKTN